MAGTTYRKTHASPYTAIEGADRRLATELVVIMANAIHVMYCCRGPTGNTRPAVGFAVPSVPTLISSTALSHGRPDGRRAPTTASSC
ncbi:hypothetical protein GCM10023094_30320 [Rhodococcus olei]|uniref:Uncharacterized protein n=1 Tax=Rhodococcus olei TaxID=2161675 RepID=A0ABP8P4B6_9NOCA